MMTRVESERIFSRIAAVLSYADEFDNLWRRRKRLIDTRFLLQFILRSVLSKNTQSYASTIGQMLMKSFEIQSPVKRVSASSVCEARQKLDPAIFKKLNLDLISQIEEAGVCDDALWHGHRIFAVDATKVLLPMALREEGYKAPTENPFPRGIVSTAYRLKVGVPYHFELCSDLNEIAAAKGHLDLLERGDICIYDRYYFSKEFLLAHLKLGLHAVFRMKASGSLKEVTAIFESPKLEEDIIITLPNQTEVRLIKYTIQGKVYVLATTLTSKNYTAERLKELYHARWGVEEFFKTIKSQIQIQDFHSKSEKGVKQEIFGGMLIVSLTRFLTLAVLHSREQEMGTVKKTNLSRTEELALRKEAGVQISNMLYQLYQRT